MITMRIMQVTNGKLNLLILTREKTRMTLTADTYGEDFLEDGELDLFEEDPDHPCNQVESEIRHLILSREMAIMMSDVDVSGLGRGAELLQQIRGRHS